MAGLIVVTNEPRAYREVLAGALEVQCPGCEISLVEPDELEEALTGMRPELVIASAMSPALRVHHGVSLLLYPAEDHQVVVCRAGTVIQTRETVTFTDILSLIDHYANCLTHAAA